MSGTIANPEGITNPPIDELLDKTQSKYSLVIFAAKRARQINAYYAQLGECFLFSNTLNCIRMHPKVSDELNDAAIGDFLLFGLNCDNATTSFRDVQRLAPGHCLT